MSLMHRAKRLVCAVLAISLINFTMHGVASAAIISSNDLVAAEQLQQDREQIKTWLAKQEVQEKLISMGVDVSAAQARVDGMTEQEVKLLAAKMDKMPAGGTGAAEIIVLAFLILVALEVTGVTDILPNI